MNWSTTVFDNLYNRLRDLFTLTKLSTNRDNIEFRVAQVVDILLQNWFMVDSKLIIIKSDEEEEGTTKPQPEVQAGRTNRVLKAHFWHAPIDINEEMEDVEEIDGTNTQPKTLKQPKISLTLLLTLR